MSKFIGLLIGLGCALFIYAAAHGMTIVQVWNQIGHAVYSILGG